MKELVNKLTVSLSDLPSIQVAIWHSIENPADLDRGMEGEDDFITPTAKEPEAIALEKERQKETGNLSMYELHPKGLKGLPHFDHMVGMRQREYADKQKDHKIRDYLHLVYTFICLKKGGPTVHKICSRLSIITSLNLML